MLAPLEPIKDGTLFRNDSIVSGHLDRGRYLLCSCKSGIVFVGSSVVLRMHRDRFCRVPISASFRLP